MYQLLSQICYNTFSSDEVVQLVDKMVGHKLITKQVNRDINIKITAPKILPFFGSIHLKSKTKNCTNSIGKKKFFI